MLRITADVNGKPIGYIFAHNVGTLKGEICSYDAAIWNPAADDGVLGLEGITHFRPDGWISLVRKVINAVT
jgi:hypothetical protein